jgi:hypothetical protein
VDLGASLILDGEQLEISAGQAVIRGQDGKVETLEFQPGRNASTSWTSSSAGLYAVDIIVTGLAPDGSLIERTNFLTLQVQPEISSQRITINLAAILAAVLILLLLVFSMIFWIFRRMVRQRKSS